MVVLLGPRARWPAVCGRGVQAGAQHVFADARDGGGLAVGRSCGPPAPGPRAESSSIGGCRPRRCLCNWRQAMCSLRSAAAGATGGVGFRLASLRQSSAPPGSARQPAVAGDATGRRRGCQVGVEAGGRAQLSQKASCIASSASASSLPAPAGRQTGPDSRRYSRVCRAASPPPPRPARPLGPRRHRGSTESQSRQPAHRAQHGRSLVTMQVMVLASCWRYWVLTPKGAGPHHRLGECHAAGRMGVLARGQ